MKILITAVAIVCAAAFANAASIAWGFGSADTKAPDGEYFGEGSHADATAFLFLGSVTAGESGWDVGSATILATANMDDNSASISNLVGFTAVDIATRSGNGKAARSPKLETPASKVQGKYIYVTFDVADGKEFVLDSVVTKMVAVSNPKTII